MFVDEVIIKVSAGKGGDGCTAFHREKFVAMGGPDGGNGGRGSNIVFIADKNLKTLIDLRVMKNIKGHNGVGGKGSSRHGASADDVIIKVPMGTTLIDCDTDVIIDDLIIDNQSVIAAYGGRGGRGNKSFATQANPAPKISELGEPGEIRNIRLELKVLADVGLIGMPSVGKSTILSMISASKPKIAAYHFTTLSPNLGVVKINDYTFTIADLPGLIEGSASGLGLGDRFLRHAIRTKILAHVIDMGSFEGRDPITDYEIINKEISEYSTKLKNKKAIIIANKMDLKEASINLQAFREKYPDITIIEISALNNTGMDSLIKKLAEILKSLENEELYPEETMERHMIYKFKKVKPYNIIRDGNIWCISGPDIEKIYQMTRFDTQESINRFIRQLRKLGIDDELEIKGAKLGDTVRVVDFDFEYRQ